MPGSRRAFVLGAAFVAGAFELRWLRAAGTAVPAGRHEPPAASFGPYLRIGVDDRVEIVTPDAEMGQGVHDSLPLLVAEELGVAWEQVEVRLSGADPAFANPAKGFQSSGNSAAVAGYYLPLRKIGAAARQMLVAEAAARWQVPPSECAIVEGTVAHGGSGKRARFGVLAARASARPVPEDPALTAPARFRLIGRVHRRKDTPPKVDGSAIFASDVRLPGLAHAAVRLAPAAGGRLLRCDGAKALTRPGVLAVVPLASGFAVVAESWWHAQRALDDVRADFACGQEPASSAAFMGRLRSLLEEPGARIVRASGDAAAFAQGAPDVSCDYEVPFLAHATMEPMSCTAWMRAGSDGDRCEIWAPSQTPGVAREAAARELGLPLERIVLHRTFLGGGFGRRFQHDFVVQCVRIAAAVRRPVRMLWSREEDFAHDFYRPAYVARYEAWVRRGALHALRVRLSGPSILAAAAPAALEDGVDTGLVGPLWSDDSLPGALRIEHAESGTPVPIGVWRSVNHSQAIFFRESFVDELAAAIGVEPTAYRLRATRDPRLRGVLEAVQRHGVARSRGSAASGVGVACFAGYGSCCAVRIEVDVQKGASEVRHVFAAVDCGVVVSPDTVVAQVQGGITFALSAALRERVTFALGRVRERNFDRYPLLRIDEAPAIDVELIRNEHAPGGVGELMVPPVAPALCNALFDATGTRVRQLPWRPLGGDGA